MIQDITFLLFLRLTEQCKKTKCIQKGKSIYNFVKWLFIISIIFLIFF